MTNRQTGKCRCGQVQFEVESIPLMSDEFKVTSGEPVIGGLHGATRHYFCPHRMSWVDEAEFAKRFAS